MKRQTRNDCAALLGCILLGLALGQFLWLYLTA